MASNAALALNGRECVPFKTLFGVRKVAVRQVGVGYELVAQDTKTRPLDPLCVGTGIQGVRVGFFENPDVSWITNIMMWWHYITDEMSVKDAATREYLPGWAHNSLL